jgi:hypothetical protein
MTIDIETFENNIKLESFKFNKVVSSFMILLNQNKNKSLTKSVKKIDKIIRNIHQELEKLI